MFGVWTAALSGARAYMGLASSYFEHVEEDRNRLSNPQWVEVLYDESPPASEWVKPLLAE